MPVIIIIFALLYFSAAYGEMLTYKDAVRETIKNSARVKSKVEDINISEAIYRQSVSAMYPELTLNNRIEKFENLKRQTGLSTIYGQVISGDRDEWRTTVYFLGEYYLSNWYKKLNEISYYEKLKESSSDDCDSEIKKILKEITDIYNALDEAKTKLTYTDMILKRQNEIINFKKRLHKDGEISYEDLLKAEAELINAEKERSNLVKDVKEYMVRLSTYTNKTYSDEAEIEGLVPHGISFSEKTLRTIEETPEYLARHKELEALREKLKSTNRNFLPDLSLYAKYDLYGSNTETIDASFRDVRKTAFATGFFATIPLFDGERRKWERTRATHEVRKQEENINALKQEKSRDIESLYVRYSELSRTVEHFKKLLKRYSQMLSIAKKAHLLGERSMMEMLEMERDILSVERDTKVTENSRGAIEKKLFLETNYKGFLNEFYGDRTCKY